MRLDPEKRTWGARVLRETGHIRPPLRPVYVVLALFALLFVGALGRCW